MGSLRAGGGGAKELENSIRAIGNGCGTCHDTSSLIPAVAGRSVSLPSSAFKMVAGVSMSKITAVDAFQMSWAADDTPSGRSAFVQIHTEDGPFGLGEASPMHGGLASL